MKHYDVLVIGAGIVGASVAWQLSKRGLSVGIFEQGIACDGASGACNGGISFLGKTGQDLYRSLESLRLYRTLEDELGMSGAVNQNLHMVLLAKTTEDRDLLEQRIHDSGEAGLPARLLSGTELKTFLPYLQSSVRWAAVSSSNLQGVVNPFLVTLGYLESFQKKGGSVIHGRVTGLIRSGERITGLRTQQKEYQGTAVVNCAGRQADEIWQDLGIDLGIVPVQGVVLVTDRYPAVFPGSLMSMDFLKDNPSEITLAIEQTREGNLLIGASKMLGMGENKITHGVLQRIAAHGAQYLQGLESLEVIRSYAGQRATRIDGPFLGKIPSLQGLYGAVGFGGSGITLAPWAGQRMAELIIT